MGGVVLVGPDGTEEFVNSPDVTTALRQGYRARQGDTAMITEGSGATRTIASEHIPEAFSGSPVTAGNFADRFKATAERRNEEDYGGVVGGAAALGLGAARGASFGLSDLFVDSEYAQGVAAENPGLGIVGEIGGALATGKLTGLTKAAGAFGKAAAGGSKLGALAIGGAAEGGVFAVGQTISQQALRNEPLTAESVFLDLGLNVGMGIGFGAVGGAVGAGLEAVGGKLSSKGAARILANGADVEGTLAANSAVGVSSKQGKVLSREFVDGFDSALNTTDDMVTVLKERAGAGIPPKAPTIPSEMPDSWFIGSYKGRNAIQVVNEAAEGARDMMQFAAPEHIPLIKRIAKSQRELDELTYAPGSGKGTGTGATKGRNRLYGPDATGDADVLRVKAALQQHYDNVLTYSREAGDPGIAEKLKGLNDIFDIGDAGGIPGVGPEAHALVAEFEGARDTLRSMLYTRGGEVQKRTLEVLAELGPEEAIKTAKAFGTFVETSNKMATMLGPEFAESGAKLAGSLKQVSDAIGKIAGPAESGQSALKMMATLGLAGEINDLIPDMPGPADELLKLWLVTKAIGSVGSSVGSSAKGKSSWISNMIRQGGRSAGARAVGGSGIIGGVRSAVGAGIGGHIINSIMPGAGMLANTTSKVVGRIENAVGKLISGSGTVTRKAAMFAPRAFLEDVRFGPENKNAKGDVMKRRAAELHAAVANDYAVQTQALRNLGHMAMHAPGVADKVIAQNSRVLKFLASKTPKDPGTVQFLGKSNWRANPADVDRFARFARAAIDPVGELERFADGQLSVEGAEVLRVLYPAALAKFQEQILHNLPALQEKLSHTQQIQMSILFGVPVTSCMEPSFVKSMLATFAADASAKPVSQAPPGVSSTPLTPAQQLLTR